MTKCFLVILLFSQDGVFEDRIVFDVPACNQGYVASAQMLLASSNRVHPGDQVFMRCDKSDG
jgi:hypothetical protein